MFRQLFKLSFFAIFSFTLLFSSFASEARAQGSAANDVVIVLPFENSSSHAEYNWIGESFADGLSELLALVPDLIIVSGDERELAYQRVRLPLTTLPSRATAIKLAREARATMLIYGTYTVTPARGETLATVQGTARVIKVNEGRLMGAEMPDGRWATREYDFGGALTTLQAVQARLAYQVLYQRDKALPFPQRQFVENAAKVPPKAFEAYVKGKLTAETDPKREIYFKNALHFYAEANGGATYPQAAFELGHFYLQKNDWKNAAEYFSKLQKKEPHYAEAAFYTGLALWRLNDLKSALNALTPLVGDLPLTGIYNNAGAISIQAARAEKKAEDRQRLLDQALKLLSRAAESAPDDPFVLFNYAYALFLSGKYAEAADQLRPVIKENQQDGQAYFLFAKSLERTGKQDAATAADDQARRFLPLYAKWQTEWQKSQSVGDVPLRLRQVFNRSDYFEESRRMVTESPLANNSQTQDLLEKARQLYQEGRDDEALPELRRVLMIEPMNAEAFLLIGRIDLRRGDQEAAISSLKTSIFWDSKMIDAHILLGRIFLERGDRAQARTYARSALQIDPNNQEAIALQRQVETGSK